MPNRRGASRSGEEHASLALGTCARVASPASGEGELQLGAAQYTIVMLLYIQFSSSNMSFKFVASRCSHVVKVVELEGSQDVHSSRGATTFVRPSFAEGTGSLRRTRPYDAAT